MLSRHKFIALSRNYEKFISSVEITLHILGTCFNVSLTTTEYGNEINWSLDNCSGNGSYGNNNQYIDQCCLTPGPHNLTCKDSYGDGWHEGFIELGGKKYCNDFTNGYEFSTPVIISETAGKYIKKEVVVRILRITKITKLLIF